MTLPKPYYQDEWVTQYYSDALTILKGLESDTVDLLVTDPPYGISFMGKAWDKALPDKNIWRDCLRVLKPGSFAFVMSIPRSDCLSRMIISLEDAGFNVGFSPIYWAYASGFPKAQNIGKAVDKRKGTHPDKSREFAEYIKTRRLELSIGLTEADKYVCGGTTNYSWFEGRPAGQRLPRLAEYERIKELLRLDNRFDEFMGEAEREVIGQGEAGLGKNIPAHEGGFKPEYNLTISSTPQAKALEGSYGGFQPKPAVEVIIVCMKPLSEKTFVDQALLNQKGITWLDDCRIPYDLTGKRPSGIIELGGEICQCQLSNSSVDNADKKSGQREATKEEKNSSFVAENVDMPISERQLGTQGEDTNKANILCSGEMLGENITTNLNTSGYGKEKTEQSLKDMKSTISTESKQIIDLKICNVCGLPVIDTSTKTAINSEKDQQSGQGRFPANLIVSDDVLNDGKVLKSSYSTGRGKVKLMGSELGNRKQSSHFDSGSFSRYFNLDKWWQNNNRGVNDEQLCDSELNNKREGNSGGKFSRGGMSEEGMGKEGLFSEETLDKWAKTLPFLIVPKASKSEKNKGLDVAKIKRQGISPNSPDPTGKFPDHDNERLAKNNHPTVKPLKLMSYLITLGSRAGDVVVDPFSGSGTTPVACSLLNRYCTAIETEEKYCEIAARRCSQQVFNLGATQ